MFALDSKLPMPLVTQIVEGFRRLIDDGQLRAGTKLTSIRQFAHTQAVSVYTVVDAYDRKGHKFVELDVVTLIGGTPDGGERGVASMPVRHTAIWQLRGAPA